MPEHKLRCDGCGSTCSEYFPLQEGPRPIPHQDCGMFLKVWTVPNIAKPYREHYNHSVGTYVSSDRQFRDELKRGSEEATLRTGVEHNFVPVDPTDAKAAGVTDAGMENTHRVHRQTGVTKPKRVIIG